MTSRDREPADTPEHDTSPWARRIFIFLFGVLPMVIFPTFMFISKCSADPGQRASPPLRLIVAAIAGLTLFTLYYYLFLAFHYQLILRLGAALGLDVEISRRGYVRAKDEGRYAARIVLALAEGVVISAGVVLPIALVVALLALTGVGP